MELLEAAGVPEFPEMEIRDVMVDEIDKLHWAAAGDIDLCGEDVRRRLVRLLVYNCGGWQAAAAAVKDESW